MSEGGEDEALAVGRFGGPLRDTRTCTGPSSTRIGEVQVRAELAGDFRREGDLVLLAAFDVDAMNLAAPGGDDFLAVGREGVAGEEVAREERFLVVALHGIFQPVLFAAVLMSRMRRPVSVS